MKNYPAQISAEVQARIEPPPILLIKKNPLESNKCDIINIKIRRNPLDAASETKKLKIVTFKHGQPEDLLQLMKNFKRAVDGTCTTTTAGKSTTYVLYYVRKHFNSLTNEPFRTLERTLPIWNSSKRVYSVTFLQLTTFPIRSAQCAVICINPETSHSSAFPPASRN